MRTIRHIPWLMFAALVTVQTFGKGDEPTIREVVVTSRDLPEEFDSTRTYHYDSVKANPESLITVLWNADVRAWQAWLPLDNRCMDPVGPRFTVELEAQDAAILDFDFSPGDGRLHCATSLKRYTISE